LTQKYGANPTHGLLAHEKSFTVSYLYSGRTATFAKTKTLLNLDKTGIAIQALFLTRLLVYPEDAFPTAVQDYSMSNKVVLITGASGALGNSVTNRFLASGATVVGASRKITADEFPFPNFLAMPADFTNDSAVRASVNSIVQKYGRLDTVIHVLGGFAGGKSVAETDDATWNQMHDQNLNSAFYVLRAAIPHLRKSGNGRIVAIGSLAATAAHPGLGAYVTFKAALSVLVQTVALENKDAGVTANVILPGTMDTPANRKAMPNADFSKWLKTESVAEVAFFLAQDSAAHITGAAIPIDGQNG